MLTGKVQRRKNDVPDPDRHRDRVNSAAKILPAVPAFSGGVSVSKPGAVQAQTMPAVHPFDNVLSNNLRPAAILQGAFFSQPSSRDDALLGKKCYAYTVFNALARAGRTPEIDGVPMTADQVNDWIRENEAVSMGGGPQTVAKKLSDSFAFMKVGKDYRLATRMALANHLPVSIGVVIGVKPEEGEDKRPRHWIYATDTSATEIMAEDQQNEHRGQLVFTRQGSKWVRDGEGGPEKYEITKVEIGHDKEAPEEYATIKGFF